jgi:hypothetical protein
MKNSLRSVTCGIVAAVFGVMIGRTIGFSLLPIFRVAAAACGLPERDMSDVIEIWFIGWMAVGGLVLGVCGMLAFNRRSSRPTLQHPPQIRPSREP